MSSLSCIRQRIDFYRVFRYRGTVLPNDSQRIHICSERYTALSAQISNQHLHCTSRINHSIDSHFSASATLLSNPFRNRRRSFYLEFHQQDLRTLQLFFCREKVAGISPQRSRTHGHDKSTSRAIKATDILPALPMIGHIFALMGVSTWKDKGRKMFTLHHLSKSGYSLVYIHFLFIL